MARYQITVHPFDESPSVDLPPFNGPDHLTEAVRDISRRVTAHTPPVDLGDRVQVLTDNAKWKNNYQGTAGEWILSVFTRNTRLPPLNHDHSTSIPQRSYTARILW